MASSDLPRLSGIELPFGNPDHDWELGIVFNIENSEGLTYIFNVNDEFRRLGIVFKVRVQGSGQGSDARGRNYLVCDLPLV